MLLEQPRAATFQALGNHDQVPTAFVYPCYIAFVLKNVTVTLPEEVALWARRKAAEENTSVSKLLGRILETQMRQSDEYWEAYRRWSEIPLMDLDAKHRLTRRQAHARR